MSAPPSPPPLAEVSFYLADSSMSVEAGPDGLAIGRLIFRGWQIHRISPLPPDLVDQQAYLVKAHYEFDVPPDVPAPAWAELEFKFGESGPRILHALPFRVDTPEESRVYELTPSLDFATPNGNARSWWPAGSAAARIVLPPVRPQIACWGVGSHFVRWRHTGGVPVGAHTAWFVLVVAADATSVSAVANGRYQVELDEDLNLSPTSRRDAFQVTLPVDPSLASTVDTTATARNVGPRVFISYAEESDAHNAAIDELRGLLTRAGADVHYAPDCVSERVLWEEWTTVQMLKADFVIVVVSDTYRRADLGELSADDHRGIQAEYQKLVTLLQDNRPLWTRKILPVILPGGAPADIPLAFQRRNGTYYEIASLATAEGAVSLLTVLGLRERPTQQGREAERRSSEAG
jgi:hypothetical protein